MRARPPLSPHRFLLLGVLALGSPACAMVWNFQDFQGKDEDASVDSAMPPSPDGAVDSTVPVDSAVDGGPTPDTTAPPDSGAPDATADVRDAEADIRDAAQGGDVRDVAVTDGACGAGSMFCGDACVDTTSSMNHCGSCNACPVANQVCQASTCVCASGFHNCSGACVASNVVTSCGTSCTACSTPGAVQYACIDGGCVSTCASSNTKCNAGTSSEACVDLTQDPNHCGSCSKNCPTPEGGVALCITSACTFSCNSGLVACPSGTPTACVNIANDAHNCGVCSNVCTAPDGGTGSCVDGGCQ